MLLVLLIVLSWTSISLISFQNDLLGVCQNLVLSFILNSVLILEIALISMLVAVCTIKTFERKY